MLKTSICKKGKVFRLFIKQFHAEPVREKEKKKESLAQRERTWSCICDRHSTAGRHMKTTT